jgi:hypothetical protein
VLIYQFFFTKKCNFPSIKLPFHAEVAEKFLNVINSTSIHIETIRMGIGTNKGIPVNIYRYKAIGANATSSVILYTGKCISPCLEIL